MAPWDDIDISGVFGQPLDALFFARDPREVARDLIGCVVASAVDNELVAGYVVESEAYLGADDPGSHAATKGITKRNAVMYGPPSTAYVYFTYGNHHMLNLVCCEEGEAGAVLLRALEPLCGVAAMQVRRGGRSEKELCSGPGKLAQALGVDLSDNGVLLGTGRLRVYAGRRSCRTQVSTSGRIGLSSGHELEYRYFDKESDYVSRAKGRTAAGAGGEPEMTGRGSAVEAETDL